MDNERRAIRISRELGFVLQENETPENRSGSVGASAAEKCCMCTPILEPGFDRDTLLNGDETTIYIDRQPLRLHRSAQEELKQSQRQEKSFGVFHSSSKWPKVKTSQFVAEKKPIQKLGTTQRSKTTFASASIDFKWIPMRMTPFLQPADQSWMRPIKLAYGRNWNNWLRTAYKPAGNMKSPGYARAVEWVTEAWDDWTQMLLHDRLSIVESPQTTFLILVANFEILSKINF